MAINMNNVRILLLLFTHQQSSKKSANTPLWALAACTNATDNRFQQQTMQAETLQAIAHYTVSTQ
jgi:hypothetical protein